MSSSFNRRGAFGVALAAGGALTAMTSTAHADERTVTGEGVDRRGRQTPNGRLYELEYENQRAVIAGVSGTLLSWQVDGEELLLTHAENEVGEGYQGKTILPWCNRIAHGTYTFGGKEYSVPINEPDRDTALHGLLSFTEWEPVHQRKDRVRLEIQQHPHYGYPFHMAFQIEFSLGRNGISATLTTTNIGEGPAPFGTAMHTYIKAADGTIDTMELDLGASTYYQVDASLIPTGTAAVDGTPYDFRQPRVIGDTTMDTAFRDVRREADGLATVRVNRPGGHDVEMWMDAGYDYLQVYTDDDPESHPPRSGIAIEPVSCAPNCFNTGDGLVVLDSGQRWSGTWGWRVR